MLRSNMEICPLTWQTGPGSIRIQTRVCLHSQPAFSKHIAPGRALLLSHLTFDDLIIDDLRIDILTSYERRRQSEVNPPATSTRIDL